MTLIILAVNALFGLIIFEWAFSKTKRHRNVDEQRDSLFPAWRRLDVNSFKRWKMYPIALTFMPLKLVLVVVGTLLVYLWGQLVYCCRSPNKYRNGSCSRKAFNCLMTVLCQICFWMFCTCSKRRRLTPDDLDYSFYLGPDYKQNYKKPF